LHFGATSNEDEPMHYPTLRECRRIIKIDDVRSHPGTELTVAAVAARKLERLANKHGVTVEALLAYARAEAAKEATQKNGSSFFRAGSRTGREWRDYVNPPPADRFETSAAQDGPRREGVTTITIATGLVRTRSYQWDGTKFPKPKIGKSFWNLFRTIAIAGLKDLMAHLKTATAFEYAILGEPIEDTPQQAKRRLGAKNNGDRNTIHGVTRPYLICDCDSLPSLGDVDVVTKLTPAQVHRYAVATLPTEFQEADCVMFYSGSHGTSPGKVKAHLWFWLSKPIDTKHRKLWLEAINTLAGLEQTEDSRVVDPAVGFFLQPIFCAAPAFRGAPDPVPERWHFIEGTKRDVAVPEREELEKILAGKRRRRLDGGPGNGGAGGATGGWRGILENMGDANGNGFFEPTKMATGLYVRQFGADCDPGPFYEVYDALIDALAAPERGRRYADDRKKDVRNLMAFVKAAEAQKGRPEARKRQGTLRPPTLAEAEAQLIEGLGMIVDAAIAEAIAGSIRRVAEVALAQGLGDAELRAKLQRAAGCLRVVPQAWSFPVGLGVGKTREALLQTVRAVKAGLRVAYHGATHDLLREIKQRLEDIDPTIVVEIWYGESAKTPTGAHACPRYEERAFLRSNGGDAAALCGSHKRGFCRFHENGDGSTQCHYRGQRKEVAQADVVLSAGGAALSDKPPEWTGRKLPARLAVVDPETGEIFPEITVTREDVLDLDAPPFDLVIVDEPVYAHQTHGLEKPLTEIGEEDLAWLAGLIKTKSCPAPPEDFDRKPPQKPPGANQSASGQSPVLAALLEAVTKSELPEPEEEEEERDLPDRVRAWRAKILWAFAEPLLQAAPGFVTYADLTTALAAARKQWQSAPYDDRVMAKALQQIAWGLIVRPQVDPQQDQRKALGDPEAARWNRLLLALRHAAAAARMALRRKENAAPEEETGFLKVKNDGRLSVRWIEEMHHTWRLAPVVVLDATHHQEIAERFVPDIVEMPRLDPGPAIGSCHVRQVFDASFSLGYISEALKGDRREGFLRELATWAEVGLALAGGTGLLVASKRLEEALLMWWTASPLGGAPEGLQTAHFNALRGRDGWKTVQWLGVVGRTMPQGVTCAISRR
jgi:hypothetical protein